MAVQDLANDYKTSVDVYSEKWEMTAKILVNK